MEQPYLLIFVLLALIAWLGVLLLPWRPWRVREVLEKLPEFLITKQDTDLSNITVVIPARDESRLIGGTLEALKKQGRGLRVILVDDCSIDNTADAARQVENIDLEIIKGKSLPIGWAGKLWALEQGFQRVSTQYVLLLDADILLEPGVLRGLLHVSENMGRPFVSVMATLPMGNNWEKLLAPAFVYFFKMLYPFALANSSSRRFASAAGGCIFIDKRLLTAIGGFDTIRGALIDDCTLARQIKLAGFRTWTGQSRLVKSRRGYSNLRVFWAMVARSAYTQLGYSPLLLLFTTLAMGTLFLVPVLGLWVPSHNIQLFSLIAYIEMAASYQPTLHFYGRSPLWGLAMPLIGFLYLAMTWSSAIRYYRGVSGAWKGRSY